MTGRLVDLGGRVVGQVRLIARVAEDVSDGTKGHVVARAVARPEGTFTLRGSLGKTPHTLNPDGTVAVEVMAIDGEKVRFFNLNVHAPSPGHPEWTFGARPDATMLPAASRATSSSLAHQELRGVELRMEGDGTLTDGTGDESYDPVDGAVSNSEGTEPTATQPSARMVSTSSAYQCVEGTYWFDGPESNDIVRNLPMHLSETRARTLNRFAWSTTRESEGQVAYNGKSSGGAYAGGLSFSRQNNDEAGVIAKALNEAWRRNMLRMGWRYRQQKLWCDNTVGNFGTPTDTGERRYRPLRWTTQNVNREVSNTFTCQDLSLHRAEIANPVWVSKSTSMRFNGWFEIYGVKLDARQTRTDKHKITYQVRSAYDRAWLCGKGNDPATAAWVREYGG